MWRPQREPNTRTRRSWREILLGAEPAPGHEPVVLPGSVRRENQAPDPLARVFIRYFSYHHPSVRRSLDIGHHSPFESGSRLVCVEGHDGIESVAPGLILRRGHWRLRPGIPAPGQTNVAE